MAIINVKKDNFEELRNSGKTILMDFYADWCMHCHMVSPVIDEIADEADDIIVGKINVDNEPELAEAFGVVSIPMLVVMKDGKIYNQAVGVRSKENILEMLK